MVTLPLGMCFIRVGFVGGTTTGGTSSCSKTTELESGFAGTGAADAVGAGLADELAEGTTCMVLFEGVTVGGRAWLGGTGPVGSGVE